jgi:MFS family permease
MKTKKTKEKTPGEVKKFALASFLNDMGSDMIYPVWPIFVTTVLGANMTILGIIDGLGEAIVSISSALSGYFSDKIKKRKVFIWAGYAFGSISRVGYALVNTWPQLLLFRVFDRAGKIRSAPRDAMVADISKDNRRGRNFGLLRSMDHLGAVVGIFICLFLIEKIGYQKLFLIAAVPSIAAVLVIFFFIKEPAAKETKAFKGLSFKQFNKNMTLFFILSGLFSLGFFSYSFLLLFAKDAGITTKNIIMLYLTFTLTASIFAIPFGKMSDQFGRKKILGFSFVLWIGVCFLFTLKLQTFFDVFMIFVLYGIQRGALEPVQRTFVAELAPSHLRASVIGAFQMTTGILALPSSFLAGFLWDNVGRNTPLFLSILLTSAAMILLLFTKEPLSEKVHE